MTYKVTDEELSAYGLDDPELSVSVDYTDDGTSDTFVLHISRDPAEKKSAADAEDEEASDITAYARVGDSKIIYQISGSSYRSLMSAGYNDLRHQEIFSGDFDDVTSMTSRWTARPIRSPLRRTARSGHGSARKRKSRSVIYRTHWRR